MSETWREDASLLTKRGRRSPDKNGRGAHRAKSSRGLIAARLLISASASAVLLFTVSGGFAGPVYTAQDDGRSAEALPTDRLVPPSPRAVPVPITTQAEVIARAEVNTPVRQTATSAADSAAPESAAVTSTTRARPITPTPTRAPATRAPAPASATTRATSPRPSAPAAVPAPADCVINNSGGDVLPHVRTVACFLGAQFDVSTIGGRRASGANANHPDGVAIDLMVQIGSAKGDAIAACALKNFDAWNLTDIIWEQRISLGGAFESMEDRGSPTANHMDHVHISFDRVSASVPGNLSC